MRVRISYQEAVKNHPSEVHEVVSRLRNGTSKHKHDKPESLEWYYQVAVRIRGLSFEQALLGAPRPVQDPIEDRASASLSARTGRWSGGSEPLTPIPKKVLDYLGVQPSKALVTTLR